MSERRRHHRTPQNQDTTFEDGRLIRLALLMVGVYLFIGFMPLMKWSVQNHNWLPLAGHVTMLAVCVALGIGSLPRPFRAVRDWIGIVLIGYMYFDLRYVVSGTGMAKRDETIVALDRTLFHGDLWSSLAQSIHVAAVSEVLHLAYLSYYLLIVIPPFLLWRKNRRHEFTLTMVTMLTAYVLCFSGSILMPVDGPRFVNGPADAPSGPFRALALTVLKIFSSHGAAFPSSHVAAAIAATFCAWRFQRRIGYAAALATVGIAVGAVYGGLHYATDIVAGTVVGVLAVVIVRAVASRPAKQRIVVERAANEAPAAPVKMQIMQQRMAEHHARRSRSLRPSKEINSLPQEEREPATPPKAD